MIQWSQPSQNRNMCYFYPAAAAPAVGAFRLISQLNFLLSFITVAFFHTSPLIHSHHIPTLLGSSPRSPCLLSTICNDALPVGSTPLSLPCPLPTSVLLLFNLVYLSSFLLNLLSMVWARDCHVTFVSLDARDSLLRLLGDVLNNLADKTGDKKYRTLLRNRCEL